MYGSKLLHLHVKSCPQNVAGAVQTRGGALKQERLLMPVPKNISEAFYKTVLSNMKKDNILRRVMNDDLILRFGERM